MNTEGQAYGLPLLPRTRLLAGYEGWDGDVFIGVGGLVPYWPGVASAFLSLTPFAQTRKRALFVALRDQLAAWMDVYGLWRVETTALASWEASCRLLEHLGFEQEGPLRKYGPNKEDFYMYARVR